MAVVISSTCPKGKDTIQEALHDLTKVRRHIESLTLRGDDTRLFYDTIVAHLTSPDVFSMPRKVFPANPATRVYSSHDNHVLLSDVSLNYLVRNLYDLTRPPTCAIALFATLRLMDIPIPNQVMCCAAAMKECVATPGSYINVSEGRFSWFKLLLGMGYPVTVSGELIKDDDNKELIKDDYGNSIIDIVATWNVKYLLQKIVQQKITQVTLLACTLSRFNNLAKNSNSIRKSMSCITFTKAVCSTF